MFKCLKTVTSKSRSFENRRKTKRIYFDIARCRKKPLKQSKPLIFNTYICWTMDFNFWIPSGRVSSNLLHKKKKKKLLISLCISSLHFDFISGHVLFVRVRRSNYPMMIFFFCFFTVIVRNLRLKNNKALSFFPYLLFLYFYIIFVFIFLFFFLYVR